MITASKGKALAVVLLMGSLTALPTPSLAESFFKKWRQSHSSTDKTSSSAPENSGNRPFASNRDLTVQTILNGLKQMSLNPKFDPKNSFEELKKQESQLRKEFQEVINEWIIQDAKPEDKKSKAVERLLANEKEVLRNKLFTIQKRIKDQIDSVMTEMGYQSIPEGSTNYKKEGTVVKVRFDEGEIKINPVKEEPAG